MDRLPVFTLTPNIRPQISNIADRTNLAKAYVTVQYHYVSPINTFSGNRLMEGPVDPHLVVGYSQNIGRKYAGITPHIHITFTFTLTGYLRDGRGNFYKFETVLNPNVFYNGSGLYLGYANAPITY